MAVGFCVTAIISVVGRAAPLDNTSAFVMGAIASGCALLVSVLLPGRR